MLLRIAVGVLASVVGALLLFGEASPNVGPWIVGPLVLASGLSLILGLLTPVAGAVVVLSGVTIALGWLAFPSVLLRGYPHAWWVVIVALAIVLLGPGAYSVDARLFGRREMVIPASPHRPRP